MSQQEIMYEIKYAWSRQRCVEIQYLNDLQEITAKGKIFGIDYDVLYIKEGSVIHMIFLKDVINVSL